MLNQAMDQGEEARTAFETLKKSYGDLIRIANPLYASTDEIVKGER